MATGVYLVILAVIGWFVSSYILEHIIKPFTAGKPAMEAERKKRI